MPRKRREESQAGVYHWIVRGMNKKDLFHDERDFRRFRELLAEYKKTYSVLIFHYCLMTNHVHLLIRADGLKALSEFSHFTQRRYAYYYCKRYRWTGSVFQRGFKSLVVDRDEYLLECGRYIERNPLKVRE
jgi:putative transposase